MAANWRGMVVALAVPGDCSTGPTGKIVGGPFEDFSGRTWIVVEFEGDRSEVLAVQIDPKAKQWKVITGTITV